jgi:predicted helicase
MQATFDYLSSLAKRYKSGISRELSYRGDLQTLLETALPGLLITSDAARIECGAPDYIVTKKNIPIGYIETKDLGKPLESKAYTEQFGRYISSLPNLIITNYLDFWFYHHGRRVEIISIARVLQGKVVPAPEAFGRFLDLLRDFGAYYGTTITSAKVLAEMMANKGRLMANVLETALSRDEKSEGQSALKEQFHAFKKVLIHDIDPKDFADIYAQTIAYGMFAARLHDPTLETFSRQEAAGLIPRSNPFLRRLFQYIAGYDLDERIDWIVDDLADIFRATDVASLLKDIGRTSGKSDPIIHFYETFLAAYDPKLRKSRGVWYTPEPVVDFIVRAVDSLLATDLNVKEGLADACKTTIELETYRKDARFKGGAKREKKEVHRVQILDPGCGTGTFLASAVKSVHQRFSNQAGMWQDYVEKDLIPRLNGFEVLMASYAVAHLKLDMLLAETGYSPKKEERLHIYLTNSLEEYHPDTGSLFASWLSTEANEANHIKRDTPVMVVMGNPPYSGISSNMGEWITKLIEEYKYVDGVHFGEKKHWLHDDYVKFIRLGEYFIERTGEGVLAYINNHSFLDNPTFRGMRWHLLNTFDKILVIDLHGNSKKKEVSPDGSPDVNVFDIQQGVSINIFVRQPGKKKGTLAEVLHADVWGTREVKYDFLWTHNLADVKFQRVRYEEPFYFFVPKDYGPRGRYEEGFAIDKFFPNNSTGIVTMGDSFIIAENKSDLEARIKELLSSDVTEEELKQRYGLGKNYAKWVVENRKNMDFDEGKLIPLAYRPFDVRWTYFDNKLIWRWRKDTMRHVLAGENVCLLFSRMTKGKDFAHVFVTDKVSEVIFLSPVTATNAFNAPLYVYPEEKSLFIEGATSRRPNVNAKVVEKVARSLGLNWVEEKCDDRGTFAPIDIFDYIYAVLHWPMYRKTYAEFLKIDFPRIPYPTDREKFWELVKFGGQLRQLHLMTSPVVDNLITRYPVSGTNEISRSITDSDFEITDALKEIGRVWINDRQYFDSVPETAWNFYVGGYQPARKWLKERRGRILAHRDIIHFQKIVTVLNETKRIVDELDKIAFA